MTRRKRKLFIWSEWKRDYTSGILVVLAYDVEEARALAIKANNLNPDDWVDAGKLGDLAMEPQVQELNVSAIVADEYGGS